MDIDDKLFLDLMKSVNLDVLELIGDDPAARYSFFKRFVELAKKTVGNRDSPGDHTASDTPGPFDG